MRRNIHENYENLTDDERSIVDEAFDDVAAVFRAYNIPMNMADPAERLVEAIATFMMESK